jgi:hypothetical protein
MIIFYGAWHLKMKQSILVHISLGWQHLVGAGQWFMGLKLCWIYIWIARYYKWMFKTCLI